MFQTLGGGGEKHEGQLLSPSESGNTQRGTCWGLCRNWRMLWVAHLGIVEIEVDRDIETRR